MISMWKSEAYDSVIKHVKNWDKLEFAEKEDLNAFWKYAYSNVSES